MTQQEGKNDIIADENTPLRSAAGVAVAKAAVRDVRTVINKYIVVIFPSAGPRFFFPLCSIAVVFFTSPSQFSSFSFFAPRFVTVLIVSTTEPQPQHHHQEISPSFCCRSADSAHCTCCCCYYRTSCGRFQQQ